ncbi:MAG: hypothetical protein RMJ56_16400 [Gemmataceae bacterium]|nr:hypothetical protein [Gemmata sp.]MDW8199178.1 hypothetical protein [Gemmataceae bacterium]
MLAPNSMPRQGCLLKVRRQPLGGAWQVVTVLTLFGRGGTFLSSRFFSFFQKSYFLPEISRVSDLLAVIPAVILKLCGAI